MRQGDGAALHLDRALPGVLAALVQASGHGSALCRRSGRAGSPDQDVGPAGGAATGATLPRSAAGARSPGADGMRPRRRPVLAAWLIRRPCGVVRLARSDPQALSGASRPTSRRLSEPLRWMLSLVAMMILGRARPAAPYQTAPRAVTSTGQGRRMSQAASTAMPSVAHACSRPGVEATMMRTPSHLHVRRRYPRRLSAWGHKTGPCLVVLPTAPPRR